MTAQFYLYCSLYVGVSVYENGSSGIPGKLFPLNLKIVSNYLGLLSGYGSV